MKNLFHAVVQVNLPVDDPYACHQIMAKYFSLGPAASRDFQFAVMGDQAYVRSDSPRIVDEAWLPLQAPPAGTESIVSATIWLDAARLPKSLQASWRREDHLQPWLAERVGRIGLVRDIAIEYLPAVQLRKPGVPRLMMTPVRMVAKARVDRPDVAQDMLANGIGRGRAFGFGCVFFKETTHVA